MLMPIFNWVRRGGGWSSGFYAHSTDRFVGLDPDDRFLLMSFRCAKGTR